MSTVTATTSSDRGARLGLALALATVLLPARAGAVGSEPPAESRPSGSEAVVEAIEGPSPLVVEVIDLPTAEVLDELRLRLPAREIATHDGPRPEPTFSYAIVRRDAAGLRMTLITPSGAAYDRDVEDVPDQSVRAAAGALATLIDSVESGRVAPTRTEVPIPPPPEPVPPTEPEPEPAPAPSPAIDAAPKPVVPPARAPEPEPEPVAELGLSLSPGVGIGVAPKTSAPVVLGGGGALGLDVRLRSGAMVVVEARGLGRGSEGLGLMRLRVAAGGGYAWRRGAFELPVAALVAVEPWWVQRDGSAAPLLRDGATRSERPLIGGALRIAPGLYVARKRSHMPSVRVGARAELAAAFVPDGGARTVVIAVDDPTGTTPAARLGGLELWLGLDVTLWLPTWRPRP